MKSIYSFKNYRDYLLHYYEASKEQVSSFSYRSFAAKAKLSSPNYLKLVINGDRNLTSENTFKLCRALELTLDESQYFEALVLMNQSKTEEEQVFRLRTVQQLRKNRKLNIEQLNSSNIMEQHYTPALITYAHDRSIKELKAFAKTKFKLTEIQITKLINCFTNMDVFNLVQGVIKLRAEHIKSRDPKSLKLSTKKFLQSQLVESQKAFNKTYGKGGKFFSQTFSVSADNFETYTNLAERFLSDISFQSDQDAAEDIAQINLQLYKV